MVSPSIVTRPSVCLRCQLREVLRQTRTHRRIPSSSSKQRCNAFSTGLRRPQNAGEDVVVRREKPYYWKKVKTPERVIGKPGRRQRAVSERLSTDSLEKPANVIVFRDVAEEPQAQPYVTGTDTSTGLEPRPIQLTAKDIVNSITGRYIAPGEAEVNASIEELRPEETIVVEKEFEEHKQMLMKGYTFPQLSRYLLWSFQASDPGRSLHEESVLGDGVQELGSTKWHPGQTPLHQRHSHVIKKAGTNTKAKLVEQILRLAWHLTVRSEEQEVGELEVRLQPWQTILLFDILNNDLPYYQSFIRSPILLEATQIQLHRPHGVMRVTGRRQDSEEVARQLKLALLKVERLELDFGPFFKTLNKGVTQPRDPLFSEEELGYVSSLTKSVIVLEGDALVAVYGISESARHNARRLLLALLDLPTRTSFDRLLGTSQKAMRKVDGTSANLMLPVDMSSGLHRRYRKGELVREVEPGRRDLVKSSPSMPEGDTVPPILSEPNKCSAQDDGVGEISQAIVNELSKAPTPWRRWSSAEARATSYWHRSPSLTGWKVEFVRILRESVPPPPKQTKLLGSQPVAPALDAEQSVVQHQVPGLQTLLSFFETGYGPRSRDAKTPESTDRIADIATATPYLVAHFVPSPSSARSPTKVPRLQIRFKFSSRRSDEPQELRVTGIIATVDEQQLKVPLPKHAVDVFFSRRLILGARLDVAANDQAIQDFTSKLQDSAHRQGGLLEAPPELTMRLPRTLLGKDLRQTASGDFEIKYLFERFEQVQRTRFTPRQGILEKAVDEEVKSLIRSIPRDIALDYREVEGGAIYGSRTMLGLKALPPGVSRNDVQLPAARESTANTESQLKGSVTLEEQQSSPTLDTDTAGSSESPGGAEEQSQARITHTGGEHGRAAPESTGDVQQVEQNAEPSQDSSSQMKELVSTALRFANLLTRATSGSLKHYGRQK